MTMCGTFRFPPLAAALPALLFVSGTLALHVSVPSVRSVSSPSSHRRASLFAVAKDTDSAAVESSSTASFTAPDMVAFANGYKTVFDELSCRLCAPSMGEIPDDLVGTYYRCGPAMFSAGSLPPPKNSLVKPKQQPVPDGTDPDRMVLHPFEGDGAVLALTFHDRAADAAERAEARAQAHAEAEAEGSDTTSNDDDQDEVVEGGATARFRYVRTNAFTSERKKGKKLYTGMDTTRALGPSLAAGRGNDFPLPFFKHHLMAGLNKKRKNTSNSRAVYFGKRLLSMWDGGLPYKLDGKALSTDGRSQLGGVIKRDDSSVGGNAAFDAARKRMVFYGVEEGKGSSELSLFEFNSKFQAIANNDGVLKFELPGLALLSDITATENYAVFVQAVANVNGMQYMLSKDPGSTLSIEEDFSLVHLVPRPGSKKGGDVKTFQLPSDGTLDADLQFINSYETDDGTVVFDAMRSDGSKHSQNQNKVGKWPWTASLAEYERQSSKKSLWRYKVHPQKGFLSRERISDTQLYFGVINPDRSGREHRFIYAAAGSLGKDVAPPQGIAKIDTESGATKTWFPESYEFCGEPIYARRSGGDVEEDGGYILSVLFNGKTESSEIVVLRADGIEEGPIARVPLGMAVPHGYHGCFATSEDDAVWSHEEISRRAKLSDKMEKRGSMWNEVKSDFSGLGLRFDDMEEYFGEFM